MNEVALAAFFCSFIGGAEPETRLSFTAAGEREFNRIDCETPNYVIEIGFDHKSGSRDSIHQAIFAAVKTDKRPAVVLIDTDGVEGKFEYETRLVADYAGVPFRVCHRDYINGWRMTAPFRAIGLNKSLEDLPGPVAATGYCDLSLFSAQATQ